MSNVSRLTFDKKVRFSALFKAAFTVIKSQRDEVFRLDDAFSESSRHSFKGLFSTAYPPRPLSCLSPSLPEEIFTFFKKGVRKIAFLKFFNATGNGDFALFYRAAGVSGVCSILKNGGTGNEQR